MNFSTSQVRAPTALWPMPRNGLPDEEDDGPLDPGTLLLVLNRLARLCHGETLDPQTGELLE